MHSNVTNKKVSWLHFSWTTLYTLDSTFHTVTQRQRHEESPVVAECRSTPHHRSQTSCRDHITPVLRQLHWLPVRCRVEFKLACLVRQALCGQMPTYLADDIRLVSEGNRRSLRSSFDNMCAVPRMHNSFGDRSFGAAGPRIWNSLPRGLRTLEIS